MTRPAERLLVVGVVTPAMLKRDDVIDFAAQRTTEDAALAVSSQDCSVGSLPCPSRGATPCQVLSLTGSAAAATWDERRADETARHR